MFLKMLCYRLVLSFAFHSLAFATTTLDGPSKVPQETSSIDLPPVILPSTTRAFTPVHSLLRTLLGAPDNVCAYINGSSIQPYGCAPELNCLFATPSPSTNITATTGTGTSTRSTASVESAGSILCCDPQTGCPALPAPTACVNKAEYSKECTGKCVDDPMTLKCTEGLAVNCVTLLIPNPSITALFCNPFPASTPIIAYTTNNNQTVREYTPTVPIFQTLSTPPPSNATSTNPPVTPVPDPNAGSESGDEGNSRQQGMIGGVIVAVVFAVVACIGGGVWFWMKKRNKGAEDVEVESSGPIISGPAKGKEKEKETVQVKVNPSQRLSVPEKNPARR